MANNLKQTSGLTNYINSSGSDIASGAVVASGHSIGIALTAIADGASGVVDFTPGKVYTVPKVAGAVFEVGEPLIWDSSAGKFDDRAATPATGDITGAVVAHSAGTDGQTTCDVMLTPGNATKTA